MFPIHAVRLPSLRPWPYIFAFAEEIGIRPDIVLGRLQYKKFVSYQLHHDVIDRPDGYQI